MGPLAAMAAGQAIKTAGNVVNGLVGGVMSGINARSNMRRQQRYNKELLALQDDYATEQADAAYEREKDFYNIQNAYNDPSAVRERYEAAGINVNSAFGAAGSYTPNQSSPSVPKADTVTPPYQNADVTFGDPLEAAYKMAMIRNIDADTAQKKGNTNNPDETKRGQQLTNELLEQGIISKKLANQQAQFDLDFAKDTRDLNIENLRQRTDNLKSQYLNMAAEYQEVLARANLEQEKIKEIQSIVELNGARVGYFTSLADRVKSDTDLDKTRKRLMISQSELNDANTLFTQARELTEREMPDNVRANTDYIKAKQKVEADLRDVEQARLSLEQEMQSYRKWESATRSAKNAMQTFESFSKVAKNYADACASLCSSMAKLAAFL